MAPDAPKSHAEQQQPAGWLSRSYPLLFALYPLLFLYSKNLVNVYFPLELTIVLCTSVIALIVLLYLVLRDLDKGALIATLLILWFFRGLMVSQFFSDYVPSFSIPFIREYSWPFMVSASVLCVCLWIARTRVNLRTLNSALNIFAIVLMGLVSFDLISAFSVKSEVNERAISNVEALGIPELKVGDDAPHILYIVLDTRANTNVLRELYGYDDTAFNDSLKKMGFTIDPYARTNYGTTAQILPAMLNMSYFKMPEDITVVARRYDYLIQEMQNSRTLKAIKNGGYYYRHITSGYKATNFAPLADEVLTLSDRPLIDEFVGNLLGRSMLRVITPKVVDHEWFRAHIRFSLDEIEKLEEPDQPMFVFAHVMSPHMPFVLDKNGDAVDPRTVTYDKGLWSLKDLYIEQLAYTDQRILEGIESVISRFKRPVAVVLMSDHGSHLTWSDTNGFDGEEMAIERMFILNALRLPGADAPPADMTPVNTFRFLFDQYFDTDLGMLEDRSIRSYHVYAHHPDEFNHTDITEFLKNTKWVPSEFPSATK